MDAIGHDATAHEHLNIVEACAILKHKETGDIIVLEHYWNLSDDDRLQYMKDYYFYIPVRGEWRNYDAEQLRKIIGEW